MKFLKVSSTIATVLLCILGYVGIGILTYRFFLPWAIVENAEWLVKHPGHSRNELASAYFAGALWPITWPIWIGAKVIGKIVTDYLFATMLSICLLAGYNPLMYAVVKINKHQADKKLLKQEKMKEVDEYLKAYGIDLPEE